MPVYNPPTFKEQYTKVVGFDAATCDYLCDGVADQVQINAAIAAVSALGGGTVALQKGTYQIAATINLATLVCVRGCGRNTVLRTSAAVAVFTGAAINSVTICDMYLEGNSVGTRGITMTGSAVVWIYNLDIRNFMAYGVYFSSACICIYMYGNYIFNNVQYCLYADNLQSAMIFGNVFSVGSVCLTYFTGGFNVSLCNNDFLMTSTGNGIYVGGGAYGFSVSGNFVMNYGTGYGLRATAVSNVAVSANTFRAYTGVYCIGVDTGAYSISIANNTISMLMSEEAGALAGISLSSSVYGVAVVGNAVFIAGTMSGSYGIRVQTGANYSIEIAGNTLLSTPTGALAGVSLANCSAVAVLDNVIRSFQTNITVGATSTSAMVKHNLLQTPATINFADAGVDTKLATVIVPFVNGTDPQDSGFLVNSTNGGDDFARTYTKLPVEVQQVVRAKVYARSAATEVHSMEADFTVYGAADNEPYTTHNGSVASLASTSANFAADDVIYWTLTAAGLLAMLGKDSIQVKVDYAAADGDNCATNAYFRTVEIEYV